MRERKAKVKPLRAWAAILHGELTVPCDDCQNEREYRKLHNTRQWQPQPVEVVEVEVRPVKPRRKRGKK